MNELILTFEGPYRIDKYYKNMSLNLSICIMPNYYHILNHFTHSRIHHSHQYADSFHYGSSSQIKLVILCLDFEFLMLRS